MTVQERHHVTVTGEGSRPMLLVHGFGCDQRLWRWLTPAFAADHRLVLFDHAGAGRSARSAYQSSRYTSLGAYADDLLAVCDALALPACTLIGHSVGALIGLLAAIRRPAQFDRIVALCPSPCYLNDPPAYHGGFERADLEGLMELMERNNTDWAAFLAPLVMRNGARTELTQELTASFCATDRQAARDFARVTFFSDHRRDLPHVSVPSLVVQCRDDAIAPLAVGRYLETHLPATTVRVLDVEGHCPHVTHPAETTALIRDYLAAHGR